MWRYTGEVRPSFAELPGPGQESVWDYPRPPKLVPDSRLVEVIRHGVVIASSSRALRLLETASPPSFYLPPVDVNQDRLVMETETTLCEWKGVATYWDLADDLDLGAVGWSYANPPRSFERMTDYFGFYPSKLECYVDGERVRPQPGKFYGGWITDELVGPFKGGPGTSHW